jgi:hypothetical protein
MSDSRINRLSQLFESKNRILRLEAAQQLAQFPLSNEQLRQTLRRGFCSPVWESRATSAHSFGLLLERLAKEVDRKVPNFNEYEPKRMQNLDLDNLLTHFKVLVRYDLASLMIIANFTVLKITDYCKFYCFKNYRLLQILPFLNILKLQTYYF